MNPSHADAKAASGNIHIQNERFPEALELLKQAKSQLDEVTVMPHPSLLQNLGVAYLRTGDSISAREVFEEILKIDPENSQAKLALHAVEDNESNGEEILRSDQTLGVKANPNASADDDNSTEDKEAAQSTGSSSVPSATGDFRESSKRGGCSTETCGNCSPQAPASPTKVAVKPKPKPKPKPAPSPAAAASPRPC